MSDRLRIAVLSRNFSTTGGGAERYSIALVEQLAARHEIHVFAQTIAHDFPGVTYHRIAMPLERPRWVNQLYFAWKTWRATRSGFDIVHSHENTWHGNVQTVHVLPVRHTLFAGKRGVALALRWLKVLTSPRLLAYLWLEKRRYAWGLRKQIVAASEPLREVLAKTFPGSQSMLSVVVPGVEAAPGKVTPMEQDVARRNLGLSSSTGSWLLFVGNDVVRKGLPALLEAMCQLPESVGLLVVGSGDGHAVAMARAQELGLASRVRFLGAVRDMGPVYKAADALVHPTLEDAYGMVVLEAMAHGLPVVVSQARYCGIARELQDGVDALLLQDPHDAVAIAKAIGQVLPGSIAATSLSQAATAFARERSWAQAAASYEGLYTHAAPRYTQRWLVLAHAFNMDGRAASQTITDKLPHLEAAGIELVVLSGVSGKRDTRYEHYQLWPAGPAGLRFELRHVLRKCLGSAKRYRLVMVLLSMPLLPFMLIEKLLRPVESSWSWWFSAYFKGRALARQRKFDLIYSTGGAFAAHSAGRALKKSIGVRWLAEVHDPLVMPAHTPCSAQERMQAEVERQICSDADVAIWFTEQALASAKHRHPQLGNRGQMLLPGIDAPFKELPPYVPGPKMVIGHFGSLSSTRNLMPIISALEALVAQRPELRDQLELQLTGGPLDAVSQAALAESPVRDLVRHLGRIEADPITGLSGREQILRRMRSADVLLLLHGTEPICAEYIPSKLYEYLWMQRPILATVHGNAQMAALLREQGHRVAEKQKDFTNSIEEIINIWRKRGLPDNGCISPYTTHAAAQQLRGYIL